MSSFTKSNAYPWALTGIFGALHLVLTLIPFSLSVSGTGAISFGMVSATILGYLLGPFYGTVSVLIGSYIGITINPELALLGPFTPLATAAGALAAGMMRAKKPTIIPILYLIGIVLYLLSPVGPLVPELIWFHTIALILSLLFVVPPISKKMLGEIELEGRVTTRALFVFALVAVTLDQIIGSAIGTYYLVHIAGFDLALVITWYIGAIFIYPVERIIGAVIITVVLSAVIESLSSSYFQLPTSPLQSMGSGDTIEEET
ncbi:MAG: hypothetical protein ACFE7R_04640 [Candidatus Hodarchaeota archaeon]